MLNSLNYDKKYVKKTGEKVLEFYCKTSEEFRWNSDNHSKSFIATEGILSKLIVYYIQKQSFGFNCVR